jgi:hypothetical protein
VSKDIPKYVKCVRSSLSRKLERGKVYEVVEHESDDYYVRDGRRDVGWFCKSNFDPMPPTYDHKEETVRKILTSINRDCTCKRCGAPTPCEYH